MRVGERGGIRATAPVLPWERASLQADEPNTVVRLPAVDTVTGLPAGAFMKRLSQRPEDWKKWWATRQEAFPSRIRYRFGKPFSPRLLVDFLEAPSSQFRLRQLALEELAVRYGAPIAWEADQFVSNQNQGLAVLRRDLVQSGQTMTPR